MLYNCYVLNNNYIVEWEIITNNYITVTWCFLGLLLMWRISCIFDKKIYILEKSILYMCVYM